MNAVIDQLIQDGLRIADLAETTSEGWCLALEARKNAQTKRQELASAYADAEADFLFDLAFADDAYLKAKNAEQRDIVKSRKLADARRDGPLARLWAMKNAAENEYTSADTAWQQMDQRSKSIRTVADLHGNVLASAGRGVGEQEVTMLRNIIAAMRGEMLREIEDSPF